MPNQPLTEEYAEQADERAEYIERRLNDGATLRDVAGELSITFQRVQQICRSYGIRWPRAWQVNGYGGGRRRKRKRERYVIE